MKNFFFVVLLSVSAQLVMAQSKIMYGFVADSLTQTTIGGGNVVNLNNGYKARSNQHGRFGVKASRGDKIEIKVPGYEVKTILYTQLLFELDTVKVIMTPLVTTLADVVVSAYNYLDYQQDSAQRAADFVKENGMLKKTFDNRNGGPGLGISIDNLFSRREKRKRKAYDQFGIMEEEAYIRFRYNPILIKTLTGLSGANLQTFMLSTQPSYEWLREHETREDMLYYINDKMKKYQK